MIGIKVGSNSKVISGIAALILLSFVLIILVSLAPDAEAWCGDPCFTKTGSEIKCGSDCGYLCGTCDTKNDWKCSGGKCVCPTPSCTGKCGTVKNKCGVSVKCGGCGDCQKCSGSKCIEDDSVGGCSLGYHCAGGTCVKDCIPFKKTDACEGYTCGTQSNGCGGTYTCGTCSACHKCVGGDCIISDGEGGCASGYFCFGGSCKSNYQDTCVSCSSNEYCNFWEDGCCRSCAKCTTPSSTVGCDNRDSGSCYSGPCGAVDSPSTGETCVDYWDSGACKSAVFCAKPDPLKGTYCIEYYSGTSCCKRTASHPCKNCQAGNGCILFWDNGKTCCAECTEAKDCGSADCKTYDKGVCVECNQGKGCTSTNQCSSGQICNTDVGLCINPLILKCCTKQCSSVCGSGKLLYVYSTHTVPFGSTCESVGKSSSCGSGSGACINAPGQCDSCGNGKCDGTDSCKNCPEDCGACCKELGISCSVGSECCSGKCEGGSCTNVGAVEITNVSLETDTPMGYSHFIVWCNSTPGEVDSVQAMVLSPDGNVENVCGFDSWSGTQAKFLCYSDSCTGEQTDPYQTPAKTAVCYVNTSRAAQIGTNKTAFFYPDCTSLLRGSVVGATELEPIPGAVLNVFGRSDYIDGETYVYSTITDDDGTFHLKLQGNATYDVAVSHSGYKINTTSSVSIPMKAEQLAYVLLERSDDLCESDCTYKNDEICHSECDGIGGCKFATTVTRNVCDMQTRHWLVPITETESVTCCEGVAGQKADAQVVDQTGGEGDMVLSTRIVLMRGKLVRMITGVTG